MTTDERKTRINAAAINCITFVMVITESVMVDRAGDQFAVTGIFDRPGRSVVLVDCSICPVHVNPDVIRGKAAVCERVVTAVVDTAIPASHHGYISKSVKFTPVRNVDSYTAVCHPTIRYVHRIIIVIACATTGNGTTTKAFEMAISIYPQFYDALFNLRDTYLELGNKTGADECTTIMKNLKKTGTIYG